MANGGGETVGGNVTRVLASDLDQLSSYLKSNFGYDTGGYQDYPFETPAKRYLGKLDYNLNDRNKISVRYLQLDSQTPVLLSNSSSLGFGNRRSNTTGLNFENSNYAILENIKSGVGEWNSIISSNKANQLMVGYTTNDESRPQSGKLFPFVDILKEGSVYTSFGFEPFTPNNELRYHTFQVQDNFTWNRGSHNFTFGGDRRALPLRQRLLPRLPERLRLQLARRLLHGRERLPRQPQPDDVAGDPLHLPGPLEQHPGPGEASPAARRVVRRPLRPGRVAGGARPDADLRRARRRLLVRRHRLRQRQRRRAHVP